MSEKCDIAVIGMEVMGRNLALNMADHGFKVAVYNRTASKTKDLVEGEGKDKSLVACYSLQEVVDSLSTPRKVMLMVKAGKPVDAVIADLVPLLSPGDVVIDGGNSHFSDTIRRTKEIEEKGLLFIGTGVSGGEEGARHGPSIMPGGSQAAWPLVKPIFQAISAKVGPNNDIPCCEWVGSDGAGHYVKMVHNGIEYGDMQLICEAYWILKHIVGLSNAELYDVFAEWYKGELNSYLIEITRDIFSVKDAETGNDLVDMILDVAGAKGTGQWMSQHALEMGIPSTLVTEAVHARNLSGLKEERVAASKVLGGPKPAPFEGDKKAFIEQVRQSLYASKICSYAQGFVQMREAAKLFGWNLNFSEIPMLWRGGCIIRAVFLERIKEAFDNDPQLTNLLLAPYFKEAVEKAQSGWRSVVCTAVQNGIPVQAFAAALAYYDGFRSPNLPANLLQAQRDYFGAHTFERVDKPRGEKFHAEWLKLRRTPEA
ncbi:MAG: decarboxylating NADP(+)-dependent phosphogluconate dehydrogenase [Planctomycetota bacterium]|nr:MAG: decarboxylating NADP(+)-dependent phosphogluconate dehydrogenase [Planctomycetota bacterium]